MLWLRSQAPTAGKKPGSKPGDCGRLERRPVGSTSGVCVVGSTTQLKSWPGFGALRAARRRARSARCGRRRRTSRRRGIASFASDGTRIEARRARAARTCASIAAARAARRRLGSCPRASPRSRSRRPSPSGRRVGDRPAHRRLARRGERDDPAGLAVAEEADALRIDLRQLREEAHLRLRVAREHVDGRVGRALARDTSPRDWPMPRLSSASTAMPSSSRYAAKTSGTRRASCGPEPCTIATAGNGPGAGRQRERRARRRRRAPRAAGARRARSAFRST